MKTEWICSWQFFPGHEKQFKTYPTLAEARQAMAKVLSNTVNLEEYIDFLRKEEGEDCGSSATFLERFLAELTIPESEEEIPPHMDIPDHCVFEFDSYDSFRWVYKRGECPFLSVGYAYEEDGKTPYVIAFNYDRPRTISRDRVNAVEIRICEYINYGTSAYPLMVLKALRESPLTQDKICDKINEQYEVRVNRKAVGRHLDLLRKLGYPVQHGPEGYYLEGRRTEPRTDVEYAPSAYPFLIYDVLDGQPKSKSAIRQAVIDTYNTRISRNAIGRLLELLQLFYSDIKSSEDGYYLG